MARLPDRPASRGRRAAALGAAAVISACLCGILGAIAAVVVQPSFTRLEQAAIILVPPELPAQPPRELVPPLGAFDRAYEVEFVPPPRAAVALRSRAERFGWSPIAADGDAVRYTTDGMVATLDPAGTVTVEVADWVRRAQWVFIAAVMLLGGVLAPVVIGRRWRRRPRLVRSATPRRR